MNKMFVLLFVAMLVVTAGCVGAGKAKEDTTTPSTPSVTDDTGADDTGGEEAADSADLVDIPEEEGEDLPSLEEDISDISPEDDAEDIDFGDVI